MDQEAQKRKERLAAIRKRKLGSDAQVDRSTEEAEKTLVFRSYVPNDEKLKQHSEIMTPTDIEETVESTTKDFTKQTLAEATEKQKEEVDLSNLAPKRPNWDLKRDVEKKMERLDRETQRAIYEIIRQRLEGDTDANLTDVLANAEAQQKFESENKED